MDLISTKRRVKKTKTHALNKRSSVDDLHIKEKVAESNSNYKKLKRFQSLMLGDDFGTSPRYSNFSRSPRIQKQ